MRKRYIIAFAMLFVEGTVLASKEIYSSPNQSLKP